MILTDLSNAIRKLSEKISFHRHFKVIIIVMELTFLGLNMFLALLRAHFNPRYARAKMILSRGPKTY